MRGSLKTERVEFDTLRRIVTGDGNLREAHLGGVRLKCAAEWNTRGVKCRGGVRLIRALGGNLFETARDFVLGGLIRPVRDG